MLHSALERAVKERLILRNGHLSDGIPGFGLAQNEVSLCVPTGLLTDGDGAVGFIKVAPLERHQFTFSQSTDQFQIKHGEQSSPVGGIQIILNMLWWKNLHFNFLYFWRDAVLGRVPQDQALLDRPFQGAMQHEIAASELCCC